MLTESKYKIGPKIEEQKSSVALVYRRGSSTVYYCLQLSTVTTAGETVSEFDIKPERVQSLCFMFLAYTALFLQYSSILDSLAHSEATLIRRNPF